MKISIFGLGYVGAVSMACLARDGHEVVGVDLDPLKLDLIRSGRSPIVEEGIQDLTARGRGVRPRARHRRRRRRPCTRRELSFICVGTPSSPNGSQDLSAVRRVAEQIGAALKGKSRIPHGRHALDDPAGLDGRGGEGRPRVGQRQAGQCGLRPVLPARVPARRHLDQGLRQSAVHRDRHRGRARGRRAARGVRPPAVRVRRPRRSAWPRCSSTPATPSTRSRSPSPTRSAACRSRSASTRARSWTSSARTRGSTSRRRT